MAEANPDAVLFEPRDVYDSCVTSIARHHDGDYWVDLRAPGDTAPVVAVYDHDLLTAAVATLLDGDMEAADEWLDFNMLQGWLGDGTPMIVSQP